MTQAVAAPPTPVAPTATPNLVATSQAVATAVTAEESAAAAQVAASASGGAADLPTEITAHLWLLQAYAGEGGAMQQALPSHDITATWADTGVNGQTGCVSFSSPVVRQEDGTITVQQLALTQEGMGNLGCESQSPEIAQQAYFLDALGKSAIYQVAEPGKLELSDAAGNLLLVFVTER